MSFAAWWAKLRPWVLVGAALAVAFFVMPRWCRTPLLERGTSAPAFSLPRVDRPGERVTTADLHGRRSVLFFWAVWCPACERMLPGLAALAAERPDVLFLAIHSDGGVDPRSVAERASKSAAMVHVTGGDGILGSWRASTFPTTYVLGADGRICDGFSGRTDPDDVAAAIDACR